MGARLEGWKTGARELRKDAYALAFACRDPRVPWPAKVLAGLVIAYAASPIDLIPDFVPVLGYLDDLIIVPLGLMIAIKMIPRECMEECRAKAQDAVEQGLHKNWFAAAVIVLIWFLAAVWMISAFMVYIGNDSP